MKYIITDWMNNICFDSDNKDFESFEDASEYLDDCLRSSCDYNECICESMGHECDNLEELREDYSIDEYNEETDRIMWNGTRYVFKQNYYKGL